ncbi:MmgE/PrpD family protein [Arthrobacter sp. M2012083]|uniref:MmgE/PrpD family protein n=1 Tax=Arthrobacter sp. M2012083 TaxID=1197706 RepID=UPI00031948D3|nr:MmgE/PrpD family protein [Arthrobacter sp. M2012083]
MWQEATSLQQEAPTITATIVERLASFACSVRIGDAPVSVGERVRGCIIHATVVGAAGLTSPFGRVAEDAWGTGESEPRARWSRSLVSGKYHPAPVAAFINGALFHARAQEDTHGTFHPGLTVLPAALAAAESTKCDGVTFMNAVLAGYEVGTALSSQITERTTPPFRATAVFGPVAAAAAVGRILGLNGDQMASALSIAAAGSGGTSESFGAGTDEWRFQPAKAAMNGYLAASLAAKGAAGSDTAFEAPAGFLECFARGDLDTLALGLGDTWNILGVTFKPFPVCAFNQAPALLALKLRSQGLRAETVESITLRMNKREAEYPGMAADGPFHTTAQTLMNARFAFATGLVHGDIKLQSLSNFEDQKVADLMGRMHLVAEEGRPGKTASATVRLYEGSVLDDAIDDSDSLLSWSLPHVAANAQRMRSETDLSQQELDLLLQCIDQLDSAVDVTDVVSAAIGSR